MDTWQSVWEQTQPSLQSARDTLTGLTPIHSRILRVGQLDAELLDEELVHVLQEPIGKALGQLRVGLSIAPLITHSPAQGTPVSSQDTV